MQQLTIEDSPGTPLQAELSDYETQSGISFPADFKNFLLLQNPWYVEETLFQNGSIEKTIECFFPFKLNHDSSLQRINETLAYGTDELKGKYITFASGGGSIQFAISVQVADYGKIYQFSLDNTFQDSKELISDSFADFIDGLSIDPYDL